MINASRLTSWLIARNLLTGFAFLAALFASLAVLLNDLYYFTQGPSFTWLLFTCSFLLAIFGRLIGFQLLLIALPLVGGLHNELSGFFGLKVLALPNAGLDLVAGYFLGTLLLFIFEKLFDDNAVRLRHLPVVPWPIALVVLMVTISTFVGISRNIYLSATNTSLFGVLFNVIHFRPIGWRDDFMPLGDWIAYALGAGFIGLVLARLHGRLDKNKIIFIPLMIGLFLASLMSLIQSLTGIGLPESLLSFRNDRLGFATIGFQPDIHSHAGHMLLGVVGLWGYFFLVKSRVSKFSIGLVMLASWMGLVLSKSRASLFFAMVSVLLFGLIFLWRKNRQYFWGACAFIVASLVMLFVAIGAYHDVFKSLPILGWLVDFLDEAKNRDLTLIRNIGGLLGSRFEIFTAAFNMFSAYPLLGVGQGGFYRLSSVLDFSKSYLLVGNGGENAHNYFLQVLAENGLIGFAICALAICYPLYRVQDKKILWSAGIALLALFIGNIYSHSFLVRENFMVAGAILALCYSYAGSSNLDGVGSKLSLVSRFARSHFMILLIGIIFVGSSLEFIKSFGRYPFQYGVDCFVMRPLGADGWTSGKYEFNLPQDLASFKADMVFNRPYEPRNPLKVELVFIAPDNLSYSRQLFTQSTTGQVVHLNLFGPAEAVKTPGPLRGRLTLSSCFTPRNLGINTDGRRIGVQFSRPIQAD